MLTVIDGQGRARPDSAVATEAGLWIDLLDGTPDEVAAVEGATGAKLPDADDREAIESSSRLIRDDDALYLTATVLTGLDEGRPRRTAVTFILHPRHLITLRDADPRAFEHFRARLAAKHRELNAPLMLVALVDALSDRLADELQAVAADAQLVSDRLFHAEDAMTATDGKALQATVVTVGRLQDRLSKARESAASLERLLSFLMGFEHLCADEAVRGRADSVRDDLRGSGGERRLSVEHRPVSAGHDAGADRRRSEQRDGGGVGGLRCLHPADSVRQHLGHELCLNAGTARDLGLPSRPGRDRAVRGAALPVLPLEAVVVRSGRREENCSSTERAAHPRVIPAKAGIQARTGQRVRSSGYSGPTLPGAYKRHPGSPPSRG